VAAPGRYGDGPRPKRPTEEQEDYWQTHSRDVLLSMLETEHAVTISEMEARGSDRTYNPRVCPYPINPHWFVNARNALLAEGAIETTSEPSRGHPEPITTWHLPKVRGRSRSIEDTSRRKRLLTARHAGWSHRGGAGKGLIGKAGENALDTALRNPQSPATEVSGSTNSVLGFDMQPVGEVDNTAFFVDTSDPARPKLVQAVFEVKNTRQWYYEDDEDVEKFLLKAAIIQRERPDQLILPVFVCRRVQYKLWEAGQNIGFLPARVENQLVLPDHELTPESLAEVRTELGFGDLILGDQPTNRHTGLVKTSIPNRALDLAGRWRANHEAVLEELRGAGHDTHEPTPYPSPLGIDDLI
jgi:hypothetical protein